MPDNSTALSLYPALVFYPMGGEDESMNTLKDLTGNQPLMGVTAQVQVRQLVAATMPSGGLRLDIRLTKDMPLLTSRIDRERVLEECSEEEGRRAVERVQELRRGTLDEPITLDLRSFGFRHASAGVLPCASDGTCWLFARDIPPVGWNIANGGSQSMEDLLRPEVLMAREAAEEILFFHPERRVLGTLAPPGTYGELDRALKLWQARLGLSEDAVVSLPHRYCEGPDTLVILHGGGIHLTSGVHLSLQAEDASLEVIRLLELGSEIDAEWLPLDGEILEGRLLDRIVGRFQPDSWSAHAAWKSGDAIEAPARLPPCPVTRHIRRAMGAPEVPRGLFSSRPE